MYCNIIASNSSLPSKSTLPFQERETETEKQRNHIDNLQQHKVSYCIFLISLLSQYVRMIVTPHNIFALTYMHYSQNSIGMTISVSQPSARLQVNSRLCYIPLNYTNFYYQSDALLGLLASAGHHL